MDTPEPLHRLGDLQDRVVARHQLRRAGIDRWAEAHRVASGRWQRVGGRVVVLHTGPLTARQRWWAAVLHGGRDAVLAGHSAARSYGMRSTDTSLVHVVVPHPASLPPLAGVRFHASRVAYQRMGSGTPPRQPIATALVSAAGWSARVDVAVGILAAGVQQGLVHPETLAAALAQCGRIRHARALRLAIADLAGGAQSFAEISGTRLARRAGIPPPRAQSVRVVGGRRRYLDLDFGTWAVEIDGGVHLRADRHAADLLRHDDLVLGGDRILRFSARTVRLDPEEVIRRMRRAHARWGVADAGS